MKLNHKGNNKITVSAIPKIKIELEAYKKMQCYIDICNKEVGWLGTAYKEGNNIVVKDVFLFEQNVHATTCELTPGGIADFVTELYNTIDADEAMEISNNLTLWGHSHVNMGVSPSTQDDVQLRSFESSGHEWFLRVIGNKRGEFEYTLINYSCGIQMKDLDWEIIIPGLDMSSMKQEIKIEVDNKVKEMSPYPTMAGFTPGVRAGAYPSKRVCTRPDGSMVVENYGDYYDDWSLSSQDFFDGYIKGQQEDIVKSKKKIVEKREIEMVEEMDEERRNSTLVKASPNDDTLMDIVGEDYDNITEADYAILDEALCHMTIDDLAFVCSCKESKSAIMYINKLVGDLFSEVEASQLHELCIAYKNNINGLMMISIH